MNIRKFQCMNEREAVKFSDQMVRHGIKQKRLGSAVIVLVQMQKGNEVQNTASDFSAHTVAVTEFDKEALINQ